MTLTVAPSSRTARETQLLLDVLVELWHAQVIDLTVEQVPTAAAHGAGDLLVNA